MISIDKKKLMEEIIRVYRRKHRQSEKFYARASRYLLKGGSHNLRLFDPFPFYDVEARGSRVKDVDGNEYIDYWQGHFANVLGHNPPQVTEPLAEEFRKGQGLITGFSGLLERELAEIILKSVKADKIRFTTSGTLASMYAVMLAMAATKRSMVLKAGGGWHGAQPFLLKGINTYRHGFDQVESAGLPSAVTSATIVTKFNDVEDLKAKFKKYGERLACFIVEPFIGAGGFILGQPEYLRLARQLTQAYGCLLIFDEVVSGFRFHPGALQTLYGIQADLLVLGKAIGGGMPVSAVAGKEEIMGLCGPEAKPAQKVKFDGGTFSAHPAAMLAGLISLRYLQEHQDEIYPRIGRAGEKVRRAIEEVFAVHGFLVRCTGYPNSAAKTSSLVGVHFMKKPVETIVSPEQIWNPALCNVELREKVFKLAMLNEGINIFHGFGAISAAHTDEEIQASIDAVEKVAKKWKKFLKKES
ncbi:MAG: aspartate aminotransferase family protein [Candidatus Aminicenantales bacterium]